MGTIALDTFWVASSLVEKPSSCRRRETCAAAPSSAIVATALPTKPVQRNDRTRERRSVWWQGRADRNAHPPTYRADMTNCLLRTHRSHGSYPSRTTWSVRWARRRRQSVLSSASDVRQAHQMTTGYVSFEKGRGIILVFTR